MPEALTLCNTYCISLPIASVYLLHHELKSWYEMPSTYSTWMKAAIMTATTGSLQVIMHLVHKLRFPSLGNWYLQLLTKAQFLLWLLKDAFVIFIATVPKKWFYASNNPFVMWVCSNNFTHWSMIPCRQISFQQHNVTNAEILTHFWRSCKVWINFFLLLLQNSLLRCWILLYLLLQYKSGF